MRGPGYGYGGCYLLVVVAVAVILAAGWWAGTWLIHGVG